jgi:hypothetical protein
MKALQRPSPLLGEALYGPSNTDDAQWLPVALHDLHRLTVGESPTDHGPVLRTDCPLTVAGVFESVTRSKASSRRPALSWSGASFEEEAAPARPPAATA